jgi:hypothetical protein
MLNPWNVTNEWNKQRSAGKGTDTSVTDKAVPLHAIEALGGRGGIAPTHSRPWH